MSESSAQSVPAVDKTPLTVYLFMALAWFMGGWFIFDGLHQRLTGDYVRMGGQLGPWAALARAGGLDPLGFAWFFIVLGHAFVVAGFMVYLRRRWGYQIALLASAISLLYLGFGTPLAIAALVLLLVKPTREHLARGE